MGRGVILTGPRAVALESYPEPPLRPGQVRVRTRHSGISAGTELAAYRGSNPYQNKQWDPDTRMFRADGTPSKPYPVRDLGYGEVGEVVELGPEVEAPSVGELVYGAWRHRSHHVMAAADARERRLPEGLDPLAGVFAHIGATALNGVHDARLDVGDTVVVFGLGVVGQIAAQLARTSGARVIGVDLLPRRLALAEELGALDVALPGDDGGVAERIRHATEGRGADVAIEASGAVPALHEAIRSVAYAARVVALGFYQGGAQALALGDEFHHNRIALISSQISGVAPERSHRWDRGRLVRTVMRMQARGALRLAPLVTHRRPFREAAEAFRMLDEAPEEALQVVLDFEGDAKYDAEEDA